MWERLTPADVDHARNRLATSRAEMLRRHAAELNALDAQQDEVETLERLMAAFAKKYLSSDIAASMPAADADEGAAKQVQQKENSMDLRVQQEISPSFGTPPRLRRLIRG